MPLPTGGTIRFSQIRTELGIPNQSNFRIGAASRGDYVAINQCSVPHPVAADPAPMSEWWGYNHTAPCGTLFCMGYDTSSCVNACNNI